MSIKVSFYFQSIMSACYMHLIESAYVSATIKSEQCQHSSLWNMYNRQHIHQCHSSQTGGATYFPKETNCWVMAKYMNGNYRREKGFPPSTILAVNVPEIRFILNKKPMEIFPSSHSFLFRHQDFPGARSLDKAFSVQRKFLWPN